MNNYKIILKKSNDFLKIYLKEYLNIIKKPILFGLIGFLSLALCVLGPIGAIIALIVSIPCICYAFWQGYLITYSLNYAADSFIKTDNKVSLIDCYDLAKKDGNELAKFLLFCALLNLIVFAPSIMYFLINASDVTAITTVGVFKNFLLNFIIGLLFAPFSNFLNQAFFYRNNQSFFELFLNCYKKLNKTGVLLVITFSSIMLLNTVNGLIYIITALILNPLIYCANIIWYKQNVCEN